MCCTILVVSCKADQLAGINFSFLFYSFNVQLPTYLVATMPSSTSVSPYMGGYISALLSSLINSWGGHYHIRYQFLTALHFLLMHFLSGFQSPASKIVSFGFFSYYGYISFQDFNNMFLKQYRLGFLSQLTHLSTHWMGGVGGLSSDLLIS